MERGRPEKVTSFFSVLSVILSQKNGKNLIRWNIDKTNEKC